MAKRAKSKSKRLGVGPKARRVSAIAWLQRYKGRSVLRAYMGRYGVGCKRAARELRALGRNVDAQVRAYEATLPRRRGSQEDLTGPPGREHATPDTYGEEWDENLAFIAGCTSGGFPYGVTWEEWKALERGEQFPHPPDRWEDDPIPF